MGAKGKPSRARSDSMEALCVVTNSIPCTICIQFLQFLESPGSGQNILVDSKSGKSGSNSFLSTRESETPES